MRVFSPLKTALFVAACLPPALAQAPMRCTTFDNIGGYAYRGTIAACGDLIRWVTSIDYGSEFVFPALGPRSGWSMARQNEHSHCIVAPRDPGADITEERISILEIWTAIETLRWSCTIGTADIGDQWQVLVATENHVGKRYARSLLPAREVSPLVSASRTNVARAAPSDILPAYEIAVMTHIAIEILGLAGLYYAQNLVHNPAIPPVINDAIPSYQTNNEDGVVLQLAQNLIGQMDANRQNRNTLSAGPLQVTLNAPLGLLPFTLFVRMELPAHIPDGAEWQWAHPLNLLDTHTPGPLPNGIADNLAYLLRSAFVYIGAGINNDARNRRVNGFFVWQLNGAQGALPEDETSNFPDIGPYVRIYVERAPNTPTPTITAPSPVTDIGKAKMRRRR